MKMKELAPSRLSFEPFRRSNDNRYDRHHLPDHVLVRGTEAVLRGAIAPDTITALDSIYFFQGMEEKLCHG
jgi:hypothetical protein